MYRMPAEWEPHTSTIIAWPHNKEDWPGKFAPIPWVYAEIATALSQHERVRILVRNETEHKKAKAACEKTGAKLSKIDFYTIPTNRVWMRDSGPIFVKDSKGKKYLLDWRFNAWAKYPNHKLDDKVPSLINAHYKLDIIQPMHKGKRVVLEGGSIDVNGKGLLLTTEECLLSKVQERNPGFKREDYEEVFAKYLGIDQVIWLGNGIKGDDTHGHVDDISRFTDASTVVTVVEKNKKDDNHPLLADNLKRLKKARDGKGKQLTVVELPMPKPVYFEDQLLPASYANFLIANNIVLVPTFNDASDRIALNILSELFKGREVVGIHCRDFVWGLGTIHCMSQQEPA
jgi:agmatine deiminase